MFRKCVSCFFLHFPTRPLLLLMALVLGGAPLQAQDTVASYRHLLALDISRAKAFQRSYDMVVQGPDSSYSIGQRDVNVLPALYAGNAAWLIVETRGGIVPAVESLFIAPDMRPIHWSSALGVARLGAEFVGDSIFGATTTPMGKHSLLLGGRPDLLVSLAMIETLLPMLPLAPGWADSAAVLTVDASSGAVLPAELSVIAEEDARLDSATLRPSWVVSVRAEESSALLWVDKENGEILRVQQQLPAHVGRSMEYRRRPPLAIQVPAITPPQLSRR